MLRSRLPAPERRHRGDHLVAAVLVVLLAGVAILYAVQSPAANTESVTAAAPAVAPAPAGAVPDGFTELWRAPSPATPAPIAAGDGVVVAGGSTVSGRDARTGQERWSYTRDLPLCTVASAFGRVLADYRNDEYCSELTALNPSTGARGPARTLDVRPGTRLIGDGPLLATGPDYLETMRSDLVRTTEYGNVRALEEPGDQPRTGCTYSSFAAGGGRVAVAEDCPSDASQRLTVLRPDSAKGDQPAADSSAELGVRGAQVVAVVADRVAVLLPGEPRLLLLDRSGSRIGEFPLAVGSPVFTPTDGVARVTRDDGDLYWWTGAATVALDRTTLEPLWTLRGTLGPGVPYGDRLLVPVPGGLADVDPATGASRATVPVDRAGWTGAVQVSAQGSVLVELRGQDVVALGPR
ncbi:PQQ-binding-like beta-propeller repeat protein [Pseudonocardia sediminis]|uniref:Rv3212 family protein n=1 Tax=Pseudonocardia sediminis TaxID=1397368 RepID=UPI0010296503|nr:PQQ-binding-like beta-propeller repeat protein [Pseudonocardia sediminis]